jgi:hypothetical protein
MSILLSGIQNQIRSIIVNDGLILFLDSKNPRSYTGFGTQWNDISKNGLTATLTGNYSFSNDVINFSSGTPNGRADLSSLTSFNHTEPHTYIAFIKPTSYPTGQAYYWLINNGSSNTGTSLILWRNGLSTSHSFITFFYNGGNNFINTQSLSTVGAPTFDDISAEVNQWVMVATVYDGSGNVTFYKNKTNFGTLSITSSPNFNSGNLNPRLAAWQNGNLPYFGDFPVAMVYNKALTDLEIERNFNAFRSRYGL